MIKLSPPQFEYILTIYEKQANPYNKSDIKDKLVTTTCKADIYEVGESGDITFYIIGQDIISEDPKDIKRIKIPILSYAKDMWNICVLSVNGKNIAFDNTLSNNSAHHQISNDAIEHESNSNSSQTTTMAPGVTYNNNRNNQQSNNYIPGVNPNSNISMQELSRRKQSFIEAELKEYIKNEEIFNQDKFLAIIKKKEIEKDLFITEIDLSWTILKILRSRVLAYKKFTDEETIKLLDLHLPRLFKTHGTSKIQPILDMLKNQSETQHVSIIEVGAWMAKNKM